MRIRPTSLRLIELLANGFMGGLNEGLDCTNENDTNVLPESCAFSSWEPCLAILLSVSETEVKPDEAPEAETAGEAPIFF